MARFLLDLRQGLPEVELILEPQAAAANEDDLVLFFRELADNTSVREVRFGGLALSEAVAAELGVALVRNHTMEVMSIANCGIGYVQLRPIAAALAANRCLRRLNLSNNPLTDAGVRELCRALERNSTLELISLFGTGLTDAIGEDLAGLVLRTRGLKRLHLGNNALGDDTCVLIARALERNPILEKIGFMRDPVTHVGAQAILQALRANTILNEVWLDPTAASEELCNKVRVLSSAISLRRNWARMTAVAMGLHPLRGQHSFLHNFPSEILRCIACMMYDSKQMLLDAERSEMAREPEAPEPPEEEPESASE